MFDGYVTKRFAFDRRTVDQDGHLKVSASILTAAGVQRYAGSEIPGAAQLGLAPNGSYRMFRPPDELRRAAAGLIGKPVLVTHRAITSDSHPHEIVAGAVGSNVVFDGVSIIADLTVWDGPTIEAVQSGATPALSCGYRYTADMTPGIWQGQRYEGKMRDLRFNHAAIVAVGRVPTAVIGDSDPGQSGEFMQTMMSESPLSKLQNYLQDHLAPEDLQGATDLLNALCDDFSGGSGAAQAADSAARAGRERANIAASADFLRRWPTTAKHRTL